MVQRQIADLHNWQNWYADYDAAEATVHQQSIAPGASIQLRTTTVTITRISPQKIEATWSTNNNMLHGQFNFAVTNNITTVQWLIVHEVKWYPWQKFSLLVSNKTIGPVMEKSLDNLKHALEK